MKWPKPKKPPNMFPSGNGFKKKIKNRSIGLFFMHPVCEMIITCKLISYAFLDKCITHTIISVVRSDNREHKIKYHTICRVPPAPGCIIVHS